MSTVINTNIEATRTSNIYNRNNIQMNKALTRVATGLKINSAQDGASKWAISQRMLERSNSIDQANQNVQNDTNMLKTAEGALSNTIDILRTLKARAVDSANASNTNDDREKMQVEVTQLLEQIDKNSEITYNGMRLIDGSTTSKAATPTILQITNSSALATDTKLTDLGWNEDTTAKFEWKVGTTTKDATVTADSSATLGDLITAVNNVGAGTLSLVAQGDSTGGTDAYGDAVKATSAGLVFVGDTGADNAVSDIKFYQATTDKTAAFGFTSSSLQAAADADTNAKPLNFHIGDNSGLYFQVSLGDMSSSGLNIAGIDVSTQDGAKSAMDTIDAALDKALKQQTKIGATEARLGYTSDNLVTANENLEASNSTMVDSDIAKEMTNYMKYAVLSQASQYMLAQASQNAYSVLNLLQA